MSDRSGAVRRSVKCRPPIASKPRLWDECTNRAEAASPPQPTQHNRCGPAAPWSAGPRESGYSAAMGSNRNRAVLSALGARKPVAARGVADTSLNPIPRPRLRARVPTWAKTSSIPRSNRQHLDLGVTGRFQQTGRETAVHSLASPRRPLEGRPFRADWREMQSRCRRAGAPLPVDAGRPSG